MVKAVAVLGSNEGVSGTIYFTQEADGNLEILSDHPASVDVSIFHILKDILFQIFRLYNSNWKYFWP